MCRCAPIWGGGYGGTFLESSEIGICAMLGVKLVLADCCPLVGVSGGARNWLISIPDVREFMAVGVGLGLSL